MTTLNINQFEKSLKELLIDNEVYFRGRTITPANYDLLVPQILNDVEQKNKSNKEIRDSLFQVVQAVERDGGISQQTYELHKYAINSFARDFTQQRWWGRELLQKNFGL